MIPNPATERMTVRISLRAYGPTDTGFRNRGGNPVLLDSDSLHSRRLACCASVHEFQGSEVPGAVVSLTDSPPFLVNRSLLYTAVTRASEVCGAVSGQGSEQAPG